MSKDKPKRAVPDEETKRKFREALDRKAGGGGVNVSAGGEGGKVEHSHGSEAHQKMFRRKAGG
ncbi:MAG: DUF5302 domain-containing protein [Tetrasphaera sp.]|jgi:hypothetical protein|nr:DUF5302 domain-containing protein [Tetrasphaera sp.]